MNRLPNNDTPPSLAFQHAPPKSGPEIYILRMKGSTMHTFTILSESMWGIWVHWCGTKSEPHYTDEARCPGCKANRPKRWKGYLHCFCAELGQEVFLELTPASAESLLGQLGTGVSLRGNRIQVKRTKGDNGRLLISVLTACTTPENLTVAKDPCPSIMALWGLEHGKDKGGKELRVLDPRRNGAFS